VPHTHTLLCFLARLLLANSHEVPFLALLSLTALVGAQNTVSDVVGGVDGLTGKLTSFYFGAEAGAQDLDFFTSEMEGFTDVSAVENSPKNTLC
jgi:hypothetical protein